MEQPRCLACQQPIDEQAVLCPYCGAAQIPQASRTDLNRMAARPVLSPRVVLTVRILVGVVLAGAAVGVLEMVGFRETTLNGLIVLISVFFAIVGVFSLVGLLGYSRDRRRGPNEKQESP